MECSLPFFIELLKMSSLFEGLGADCPLAYHSNHASEKRTVLLPCCCRSSPATTATAYHGDSPWRHPSGAVGCCRIRLGGYGTSGACPDRRIVARGWLDQHLAKTTQPVADCAVSSGFGYIGEVSVR